MLVELSIRNFAIIDSLTVPFDAGLTVLTGETGAGKSIIIDAIGLLVGGRGSTEFVRHGERKAEIEGLFQIEKSHPCTEKIIELGIEVSDGMIVLNRDITASGKSICRINGKLVTLAVLREIGHSLIDIHGQHEHQFLLQSDQHIQFLDQFANVKLQISLDNYRELFDKYVQLKKKLKKLTENEKEMAQRIDLLQYQIEEIGKANLEPGEDDKLEEERLRLSNYEKLFRSVHEAREALSGENKGLDWIGQAMSELEHVADLDEQLGSVSESVSNAFYLLEECSFRLRDYFDNLEYEPERINFVEERLNEIRILKRKYGSSISEILEYGAKIEDELDTIINRDDTIKKLQNDYLDVRQDLWLEAKQLTALRKEAANELIVAIHQELKDLYMEKTKFDVYFSEANGDIELTEKTFFNANGIDQIEFMISTNPGEPLKPLVKIASGGELSRIILAMKSIFSHHKGISSIIFDEVDTGVSGRAAQAIAEKIHKLSIGSQVLCITHLPQVAAMSDIHLYISKETKEERTFTQVQILDSEDKIKEIGRMLSGAELTSLTKEHAREMINYADNLKSAHEKLSI
jgi:DNA repair protein RecN (Recombination protein N)